LISQGLGTSMLQMGNIVKNPRIWIAPTLASAITGPIATCIFKLQMNGPAVSSGMGTCGLVGQIGVYTGWLSDIAAGTKSTITPMDWIGLILICFILPAVLSWGFGQFFRKIGWIKENDLKLD
ncbi:MAG: PTS sugar transporter subunit IIC, partial [Eisenbergiella sp.]